MKIALKILIRLQQYLPFTVLKHINKGGRLWVNSLTVATVLTVYGIETLLRITLSLIMIEVATVLTVYGI